MTFKERQLLLQIVQIIILILLISVSLLIFGVTIVNGLWLWVIITVTYSVKSIANFIVNNI